MERQAFIMFNFLMQECAAPSTLATVAEDLSLSVGRSIVSYQLLQRDRQSTNKKAERVHNYYEAVIPAMSLDTFKSHFRMSRNSMETLCRELAPHLEQQHKFVRLPVEKKIFIAIWSLANQDVYRKIANLFNTSRGGAQCCVMEVCQAINKHLKPVYIKLPTAPQCATTASETEEKHNIPGVCGFIDGTQIPIKPPSWDRDSYINRKGFPSVNVLAMCDNKMLFTYVYVDRAGLVHDARVLRVSSLGQMLENHIWPGEDFCLLGDSAYSLLPSLLVPYRDNGHLNESQRKFNAIHSSARSIVERAFGRLKGKFRRLKGIDATCTRNALEMIEAAFTLHNFILHQDCEDGDDSAEDQELVTADDGNNGHCNSHMGTAAARQLAKQKRDRIAARL